MLAHHRAPLHVARAANMSICVKYDNHNDFRRQLLDSAREAIPPSPIYPIPIHSEANWVFFSDLVLQVFVHLHSEFQYEPENRTFPHPSTWSTIFLAF
ncbi:hypothetical protein PM082_019336 [Marasmius tenuissimus]|nr:hypothetical protein PM082_019336 [Marasmius tenuissimus]